MTPQPETPTARAILQWQEGRRRRAELAAAQAVAIAELCALLDCTPDELRQGILRYCKTHDKIRQNPTR